MFKDMVKQNRSYRSFDGSYEISKETLTDLIDCARFTPSSVNMQPFQYFISYKPKTNDVIFPLTAWARWTCSRTSSHRLYRDLHRQNHRPQRGAVPHRCGNCGADHYAGSGGKGTGRLYDRKLQQRRSGRGAASAGKPLSFPNTGHRKAR